MYKKKLIALLCAATMASCLTCCGAAPEEKAPAAPAEQAAGEVEAPTEEPLVDIIEPIAEEPAVPQFDSAEELLEHGLAELADVEAVDLGLKMDVDAEVPMDEFSMNGVTMSIALNLDGTIQSDMHYSAADLTISASMLGMSFDEQMKMYYDHENNISYEYDAESDSWTYSISEEENDADELTSILDMDSASFRDVQFGEEEDDYLVVSAKMDAEKFSEVSGNIMEDMVDLEGAEDTDIDVEVRFDKKTNSIHSMAMTMPEGTEVEGAVINRLSVEYVINALNDDVQVAIPAEVVEGAVEKIEEEYDWDKEYDFGSDWDSEIDWDADFEDGDDEGEFHLEDGVKNGEENLQDRTND